MTSFLRRMFDGIAREHYEKNTGEAAPWPPLGRETGADRIARIRATLDLDYPGACAVFLDCEHGLHLFDVEAVESPPRLVLTGRPSICCALPPCPDCAGSGRVAANPRDPEDDAERRCPACGGEGVSPE